MHEKADGGFGSSFKRRLGHGLPAVLLLSLLTVVLHHLHLGEVSDGWFMRDAMQTVLGSKYGDDQAELTMSPPAQAIQVLKASTLLRVLALEHNGGGLTQADLDRVGGVRPIDRDSLAGLLQALASRIGAAPPGVEQPRVVAIDVDIAPIASGASCERTEAMSSALEALRQHVQVIAIALDRSDERQRTCRNQFMREACSVKTRAGESHEYSLHFALPHLFHKTHGYALDFPYGKKDKNSSAIAVFPSLGNLLYLAMQGKRSDAENASLAALCTEVSASVPPAHDRLLDRIVDEGSGPVLSAFQMRRINWRQLESDAMRFTYLQAGAAMPGAALLTQAVHELQPQQLAAGAIVLGVDGGSRHDKFDGASGTPDPISGPMMHALVARSSAEEQIENPSWSFAVDAAVGVIFVLLWSSIFAALEGLTRDSGWRRLLSWAIAAVPPLLALGLGWGVMRFVSPSLLEHDIWANPAYVLGGLVLHAYVEAWHVYAPHEARPRPGFDFSFGAAGLWRQGWRPSQPWDAWVVNGLCLAVAGAGIGLLLWHGRHGWPAAAFSILLIVGSLHYSRRQAWPSPKNAPVAPAAGA